MASRVPVRFRSIAGGDILEACDRSKKLRRSFCQSAHKTLLRQTHYPFMRRLTERRL
jgi:hypothetical protein